MKDLLLLINPKAGRRVVRNKLMDIADLFIKEGYAVAIYITQGSGDATRYVAKHGDGYDLVVCCGGDGTLSETVNGLAQLKRPPAVGYISGGTTNDVGFSLHLPFEMNRAAETAVRGQPMPWDIGLFNGDRYFCYVAAFGLFTEVTYATDQQAKNALGRTAYLLQGARSLSSVKSTHITLDCDGQTIEDDYILFMMSNTVSVGGFRTVFSELSRLDDGLFEVLLVKRPRTLEDLNHVTNILLQLESVNEIDSEFITVLRGKKVRIRTDHPVAWTIDGEYGGETTDVAIEVCPQMLTIMTGDPEKVGDRRSLLSRIFRPQRKTE